ncbi:MAG: substrate-binding domain-containing protein [Thermoplasmata archaeon]
MSTSPPGAFGPPSGADNLFARTKRRRKARRMSGAGVALVVAVALIAVGAGWAVGYYGAPGVRGQTITISGSGSSLLWPMLLNWSADYTEQVNSNIHISVGSTGSGTGQALSICGNVNLGMTDTFIVNASAATCSTTVPPSTHAMAQIPTAISSQLVCVNLPGLTSSELNLNGTVLGMIYNGNITQWNDPLILAAQTPAVRAILNGLSGSGSTITPVGRSDSSGDTGLFTGYLTMAWAGWTAFGHTQGDDAITGTKGQNLNPSFVAVALNTGVLRAVETTIGALGYVGISYRSLAGGVEYANLGDNRAISASGGTNLSNYAAPTPTNIAADVTLGLVGLNFTAYGLALVLILGGNPANAVAYSQGTGGRSPTGSGPTPYPIVNLEYVLVRTSGTPTVDNPGGYATAIAVVQFLQWVLSYGNQPALLEPVGFLPLTPTVVGYATQILSTIQVSG